VRTFIAIDIPSNPNLQDLYHDLFLNLQGIDIKYLELNNLHITLAFLGETSEEQIKMLGFGLKAIQMESKAIELDLHGLGVFKNAHHPQVLWVGIKTNDVLKQLWALVNHVVEKHGFKPDERGFSPHLTIGRIKKTYPGYNLVQFIKKYENACLGHLCINDFIFYQSILTQQGPIYKPIQQFSIK
jgi:2'-5' RNA ligase